MTAPDYMPQDHNGHMTPTLPREGQVRSCAVAVVGSCADGSITTEPGKWGRYYLPVRNADMAWPRGLLRVCYSSVLPTGRPLRPSVATGYWSCNPLSWYAAEAPACPGLLAPLRAAKLIVVKLWQLQH